MDSKNPILRRATEQPSGSGFAYNEGMNAYNSAAMGTGVLEQQQVPTAPQQVGDRPLTIDDVITKTAISFVVLLVGAGIGWVLTPAMPWLPFVAMLAGLGIYLFGALRKVPGAGVTLVYSLVEGVMLGGVSMFYQDYVDTAGNGTNIIAQAVLGTLVAFGVMLFLYRSRIIKVNGKFVKIMMVAMVSYLVIALASLVSAFFGVGGGWGFYGVDGLGIILCVVGVGLAAFTLNLDFAQIEQGIQEGVSNKYAWMMALGLIVTLVWLYLEILRFLAILNSNN